MEDADKFFVLPGNALKKYSTGMVMTIQIWSSVLISCPTYQSLASLEFFNSKRQTLNATRRKSLKFSRNAMKVSKINQYSTSSKDTTGLNKKLSNATKVQRDRDAKRHSDRDAELYHRTGSDIIFFSSNLLPFWLTDRVVFVLFTDLIYTPLGWGSDIGDIYL
jgi:hypothetical protein